MATTDKQTLDANDEVCGPVTTATWKLAECNARIAELNA